MKNKLPPIEIERLLSLHKSSDDKRERDRIKAILAYNDGYSYSEIARILLIDDETVRRHIKEYMSKKKTAPNQGGSQRLLNKAEQIELSHHLEEVTYLDIKSICAHVKLTYGISYSISGMRQLVYSLNFCYKKPHAVPAKANKAAQARFVEGYEELKKRSEEAKEPIYFMDAVHPEHQTKMAYGWIKRGCRKPMPTTPTQKRVHYLGALNLEGHRITYKDYDTVNGTNVIDFLNRLRGSHRSGHRIHLILDNVSYQKSKKVRSFAESLNITLHYLPPYSPNLNPIERLWKIMHEHVTYNQYYPTFHDFREAIRHFFRHVGKKKKLLRSRLTDNFQTLNSTNFAS